MTIPTKTTTLQGQASRGRRALDLRRQVMTVTAAVALTGSFAAQPALAGPQFPPESQSSWIERSNAIIAAINADAVSDAGQYVARLDAACSGMTGYQMSHRMPNWAAMPQGFICVAAGELKRAYADHSRRGGGTAYCGTARRAAGMARSMPRNEDSAPIAETMAALAAAADRLTTLEFAYETRGVDIGPFSGMGGGAKAHVLTCK